MPRSDRPDFTGVSTADYLATRDRIVEGLVNVKLLGPKKAQLVADVLIETGMIEVQRPTDVGVEVERTYTEKQASEVDGKAHTTVSRSGGPCRICGATKPFTHHLVGHESPVAEVGGRETMTANEAALVDGKFHGTPGKMSCPTCGSATADGHRPWITVRDGA